MLTCSFRINYGISQTLAPSHSQWLIPFAVQLIPGGLLLFGTVWLRESPRWLIGNGQRDKGLANLCWIRQLPANDIYIVEEVASIDAAIEEQRHALGEGFWKPFIAVGKNRKVQWRFFLGGALFMWQNGSGINAINYYSPTVFASLGITGTNQGFLTTGIFGNKNSPISHAVTLVLTNHKASSRLFLLSSGSCSSSTNLAAESFLWAVQSAVACACGSLVPTSKSPVSKALMLWKRS